MRTRVYGWLAIVGLVVGIAPPVFSQTAPLTGWNVKASPYNATGNGTTPDTAAFNSIISACPAAGCRIYVPDGTYVITATLNIPAGKSVSFIGESKKNTALVASGIASGQPVISYNGTSGSRIDSVEIRNLAIFGGTIANGVSLSWVLKSTIDNVLFSTMNHAVVCSNSFTNTFSNNNTYSLLGDAYRLSTDCNNNTILGGAFGSAQNGVHVVGSINALTVLGSNCEDVSTSGYCVFLEPPSGARVEGVTVQGTHFERVRGAALFANGVDADSVVNLKFDNNFVAGGYRDAFGQAAGLASYAVILRNAVGFEANNNIFYDWQNAAFAPNGTESNGSVEHNQLLQPTGASSLTLTSPVFRPSVRLTNNATSVVGSASLPVGRQELFRSTSPNVGSCNVGDITWNTAPALNAYAGWVCITAGSPGTWASFGLIQ